MFRSMSSRRGPSKYEKLEKESYANGTYNNIEDFKRSTSLPSRGSNSSIKMAMGSTFGGINLQRNPTKKANNNHNKEKSTHPIFGFFDFRRKKKTTASPQISRYMEYVKEGGMWDSNSSQPVIYYK